MKNHQIGFGGLQLLLVIVAMGVVSMVAVPKYQSFIAKAKITEAFTLAGESRRKLSEFYMTNGRFPKTAVEAEPMKTVTLSPPEFVRDMVVEPNAENHDVMIKVYVIDGVFDNPTSEEQFIYLAVDKSTGTNYAVDWSCGARGIDPEILPEDCGN